MLLRYLLVALFAGTAALAPPLQADGYELKAKKITVNRKNADVFPVIELRPVRSFGGETQEPKFRSSYPQRYITSFGKDGVDVCFAADELKGSGKGFDLLYVDLDGEGNLAKGKRLTGKPAVRSSSFKDTEFKAFKVEIPGFGDYTVQARLAIKREALSKGAPGDSTLYLTALMAMEGSVEFAGQKQRLVVFDANCNGIFGEKGSPRRGAGTASGDKIWIGSGSPKLDQAFTEALPIGRYYCFEGVWYELRFTSSSNVEIKKADVALGKLAINNPGFLLELADGHEILIAANPEGNELMFPVGSYEVTTPGYRMRGPGGIWELQGQPGSFKESFSIEEGQTTELAVGPPLKIEIATSMRQVGNGLTASFDFKILGANGETYKYLLKNGKKVDLPKISIRDPNGREVKKGHFEYG